MGREKNEPRSCLWQLVLSFYHARTQRTVEYTRVELSVVTGSPGNVFPFPIVSFGLACSPSLRSWAPIVPRMIRRCLLLLALCLIAFVAGSGSACVAAPQDVVSGSDPVSQPAAQAGPDTTRRGIVWDPPSAPAAALQALDRISATGADAVRLLQVPPDTVFAHADSLGLSLFVDLPVAHASASALSDSLHAAEPVLDRLMRLASRHEALQSIGLAHLTDTTVPTACETLSRWSEQVTAESQLDTYYVTPFTPTADRCRDAVNRVLLDLRGRRAPIEQWQSWTDAAPEVGIGALGTWTRPGAASGLQVPNSAERQARYLENALSSLLEAAPTAPSIVFVHRWRDAETPLLSSRRYGLHTGAGTARPAARVVDGLFTGSQGVFAFPAGTAPARTPYGLLLLGWGLVIILAGLYVGRPFVRQTIRRYFGAHGFYRDAIRKGRELEPGATAVVLSTATVALGLTSVSAARSAATLASTEQLLAAVPEGLRSVFVFGVEHPAGTGLVLGGAVLWLLLLWMTALIVVARQQGTFSLSQGLMLVTWPCWPIVPALPLALVAHDQPPVSGPVLVVGLLCASVAAMAYFTLRVLWDYRAITGRAWTVVAPLGLLSPPVLAVLLTVALVVLSDVPLRFLWRLATLT